MIVLPFFKGWLTTTGLLIAIGPQNAFVLKQGLMKNHVFVTAFFCACTDTLLIILGVGGFGTLLTSNHGLMFLAKWGGAAFLFWYGFKSLLSVFRKQTLKADAVGGQKRPSLKQTLLILPAVCLLNPHVYLDTVVLLGSIGSQFETRERPLFAWGAICAALIWFFSLCYGARFLAPFFEKQISWKILDGIVAVFMWAIALSLIFTPLYD